MPALFGRQGFSGIRAWQNKLMRLNGQAMPTKCGQGGSSNRYRDGIIDETCLHFFGKRDPTDWDIKNDYQSLAVSIFRRLTVSRAKQAGSARDVARDIAEAHAFKMLPAEVLNRVRTTSMGPPTKGRARSPSRPPIVLREAKGRSPSRPSTATAKPSSGTTS